MAPVGPSAVNVAAHDASVSKEELENGIAAEEQMSFFKDVELAPDDSILGLQAQFVKDPHPDKISLLVGAYRTEEGLPYVLPVVRNIEIAMASDKTLNHEYLPIEGMKDLAEAGVVLAIGDNSPALIENRVCAVQTLSGTGALRVGFEFLFRNLAGRTVALPKPTWNNHIGICRHTGYTDIREYHYFNAETRGLDLERMLFDLRSYSAGSIILLHACAQNPCGVDPSQDEWRRICQVIKERNHLVVFDMAYQGFVSGDPDIDAWAIRYFVQQGLELLVCQSFAKMFGIYNERCGNLVVVSRTSKQAMHNLSQLKFIIRPMYSNPPNHGARIVATILNNPAKKAEWLEELKSMSERIKRARLLFFQKLKAYHTPGDWSHIINQCGMFTFTGLDAKQVDVLKHKYHIHLLANGRINMCGINPKNVDFIAKAFSEVVQGAGPKL